MPKPTQQIGVVVTAPNMQRARFTLQGIEPLMTARFSKKAEIMGKHAEGDRPAKRAVRKARDFDSEWLEAAYRNAAGWYGINASAFRKAAISACRLVNFKMTLAKLSIFVESDGSDEADMIPLVRITKGDPKPSYMNVRNATGVVDIRARPFWEPGWQVQPVIRWDGDQFTLQDISNLMTRVGLQVGIGEGRPDSRDSAGLGYGLFELLGVEVFGA
jgi:hypothetical protein